MHDISYLRDIIMLLLASLIVVVIFQQIGLSPALGYVVAGTAIGPYGFGIISGVETSKSIAELGIVFMLFAIGLELTFARLMTIKKYVIGFGGLQIFLTTLAFFVIGKYYFKFSNESAVIIACALAMSSTAIVMQVIAENAEQSTRAGRLAFSILLMQDLAVIPILVLLPLLKNTDLNIAHALGGAMADALVAMVIIFAVGRIALRPLYRLIAQSKNDVLFLSFTLIVIFGAAYLTHYLGMSFALGAFIAGLLVAETEYRYRVEHEILSLKSIFLGLFFMTIGMSFDFELLIKSFPYIMVVAVLIIVIKAAIIILLCKIFKFPMAPAFHTALLLAQGGEFTFVVFLIAVQQNFLSNDLSQFLMTTVTFTMALTPILATLGRKTKSYLYTKEVLRDNKIKREIGQISKHIIVIGFSRIGRIVSYVLKKKNLNYIILENNHRIVTKQRAKGYNIYYGDALNVEILKYIGIDRAESIVLAIEDEFACNKITNFINQNFPNATIITKADSFDSAEKLNSSGASFVVLKNIETGIQLSNLALASIGTSSEEIADVMREIRNLDSEIVKEFVSNDDQS